MPSAAGRPSGPTRFMLDTNMASFVIRGANENIHKRLRATPLASTCISSITHGELLFGLAKKPEATALREAVASFLRHVEVMDWGSSAAGVYGDLRAALEAQGKPLGNLDTLIAAHALATGCALVTNDKAFARVPGLVVEDWTRA
jgi:tRNA(fMet)-specific endonuclease VapC